MMRTLVILSVSAVIIVVSVLTYKGMNQFSDLSNSSPEGYAIGDAAEDFSLKATDGKIYSLANYEKAKGFIVVFTTNHCPYSNAYEDRIKDLHDKFLAKGYPVIAINPNNPKIYPEDSFEEMQIRANRRGYNFPYLIDEKQEVYKKYGATKTPHVYVLEKENGENIVRYIGAIDDNYKNSAAVKEKYVENAVKQLLAGEEVERKLTKAIGCRIK
ncbi:thioredoxin family protein [Haloflavibacter putidus]|nr:thioredoxin family protein [Haloflavibacter putidus]